MVPRISLEIVSCGGLRRPAVIGRTQPQVLQQEYKLEICFNSVIVEIFSSVFSFPTG